MRIKQVLQPSATLLSDQRIAADIVTEVLLELKELTKPDVSLDALDEIAERMIIYRGGTPYNKGYKPSWSEKPYPNTICCSVDFEVCHAPPRGRSLREGSIVNYDLSVRYKSGCGDAAITVPVGEVDNRKQRLMRYALRSLYEGIKVVKAGISISDIGTAIDACASINGYQIIKDFGGHHIGRTMHEDPLIPHYYVEKYEKIILEEGAVICIEPMMTPGKPYCMIAKEDGWTFFCPDGQPVAMFEHQILVKVDGYEILTKHIDG